MNKPNNTLCWNCANACNKGCSWSEDFTPVEGWKAEPYIKNGVTSEIISYEVIECPEFVSDKERHSNPQDISTEGMMRLLSAFLKQLRFDYVHASCASTRQAIEHFLVSGHGKTMLQLSDPKAVISGLRRMIKIKK